MNNNSHTLMQQIDVFVNKLNANSITAPSTSDDVKIIIQDSSFSIKSQLGSASTLLNAGNTTNILYRLSGKDLTDDDIANINGIENHLPRMKALFDMGCKLEYVDTPHDTFRDNLQFLDTSMPLFIAECLVADCEESSTSKVSDVVAVVAKRNPLHYMGKNVETFYEHKMKVLLVDVALGMTPSKQWLGKYDANGGYLVVRKDGEVVCYHFYNRNDIEDYLYYNTRFERASRSRYGFGSLYRGDDGQVYIKLNLQIRFLK
jgi:type II restriction enzyme